MQRVSERRTSIKKALNRAVTGSRLRANSIGRSWSGRGGSEPPTPRSRTECSTRLSHAPSYDVNSYSTSTTPAHAPSKSPAAITAGNRARTLDGGPADRYTDKVWRPVHAAFRSSASAEVKRMLAQNTQSEGRSTGSKRRSWNPVVACAATRTWGRRQVTIISRERS